MNIFAKFLSRRKENPLSLSQRVLTAMLLMFMLGFSLLVFYVFDTSKQLRRGLAHVEANVLTRDFMPGDHIDTLPHHYDGQPLSYTQYNGDEQILQISANLDRPRRFNRHIINSNRWLPMFAGIGKVITIPVYMDNGDILMVARNDQANHDMIEQLLRASLRRSIMLLVPLLLLFSGLIWALLRWTLKPVFQAAQVANSITPDHLRLIPTDTLPNEIKPLARAANRALQRLTKAYQTEQRFVADVAHELRTPLSILRLRLYRLRCDEKTDLDGMKRDLNKIQTLVEQLLELARLEGNQQLISGEEQVDLCRLVRQITANYLPLFEKQQRILYLNTSDYPILHRGNPYLYSLVFKNLLENALHHGQGQVSIHLYQHDELITLQVNDQGQSPPAKLRTQLFERFKKGQENTNGCGLGLSIARQTVQNMGGAIHFRETPRTSIEVVLKIPCSDALEELSVQPL